MLMWGVIMKKNSFNVFLKAMFFTAMAIILILIGYFTTNYIFKPF